MGPDKFSSLTTTSYYVKSVNTRKFFYTDDVVQPPAEVPADVTLDDVPIYLEERGNQAAPVPWASVPTRRLRRKTTVPAISMLHIEGEDKGFVHLNDLTPPSVSGPSGSNVSHVPRVASIRGSTHFVPEWLRPHVELEDVDGSDEESWSLSTDSEETSASSHGPTSTTQTMQSDEEDQGGGEWGEAPNNRAGGSYPVASKISRMTGPAALRRLQNNLGIYIQEEYEKLDATTEEQVLWIGALTNAVQLKAMVECQLRSLQQQEEQQMLDKVDQEFLVTKTVGNAEVWSNLEAWQPSIKAEYDQLVVNKQAVRQITKEELHRLAEESGLPIEVLPGKLVHTRKCGSGAYKTRAVVCGNYEAPDDSEHYAGGSDANQVRAMLRLGALHKWTCAGTDVRTAFLNAPRRDSNKLLAMEIPMVFRKLGLAESHHIWLIDKALYGLTSSPRDWSLYRDETVPQFSWQRDRDGRQVKGSFKRTPDENVWRIEEVDCESQQKLWTGLLSVYVDDLLFVAEEGVIDAAAAAIEKTWAISKVEKTGENASVTYCGFEIEAVMEGGFKISQNKYEMEMIQRWNIKKVAEYPNFKTTEEEETSTEPIDPQQIKQAQAMAGALLWLSTRTRPDLSVGVATVCRMATRNPARAIEIGTVLMEYVKGNPGGLIYPAGVPGNVWGERGQLKIARHPRLLEVMADIAFGSGSKHRSIQGITTFLGGCIISWNTTVQPFVTHSTAESELVAYCDALNVGRSTEAMLCAMLGEPVGTTNIERVIYGDNLAAIGIASGTGGSSWRTRHLRIRASYVREALDGTAPGGMWRLIHLSGKELVADGMTKPLQGQAFAAFRTDLGMQPPSQTETDERPERGVSSTAVMAMMAGSLLLSGTDAEEGGDGEAESQITWICGAMLMVLGAVYAGQFAVSGVKCCLKRLQVPSHRRDEDSHRRTFEDADSGCETTIKVKRGKGSSTNPSSLSVSIKTQSGLQHDSATSSSSSSSVAAEHGSSAVVAKHGSRAATAKHGSRAVAAKHGARAAAEHGSRTERESSVAATGSRSENSEVPANPWNKFQREHKNMGLSNQTMSRIYQYQKHKDKMP